MYEVLFYEDAQGCNSVRELLVQLNEKAATDKLARAFLKKVFFYIERLERAGTWGGEPYTKYLQDGIWELRPGDLRILFFGYKDKFILLRAFTKTTRKTPKWEIERAKREMQDWLQRNRIEPLMD